MDFTGPLNYINRVTQSTGSSAQKAAFAADRMGRLMTIHDGRGFPKRSVRTQGLNNFTRQWRRISVGAQPIGSDRLA